MFQRIQGVGLGLLIATAVVALAAFGTSFAQNEPQGTPLDNSFTYQGRLTIDGVPANGNYDFEFEFWDAAVGGTLKFNDLASNVPVVNGQFSAVLLLTGEPGERRFLAVLARPAGPGGTFVSIGDRQELTPTPYAIYAMTAGELSSSAAAGFIQNGTTQQPTSNFNISGDGTVGGTLSANIFALNGVPTMRTFGGFGDSFAVGPNAGNGTSTGLFNTMLGGSAGAGLTSGDHNVGVGRSALNSTSSGNGNSALGYAALIKLTTGSSKCRNRQSGGVQSHGANREHLRRRGSWLRCTQRREHAGGFCRWS